MPNNVRQNLLGIVFFLLFVFLLSALLLFVLPLEAEQVLPDARARERHYGGVFLLSAQQAQLIVAFLPLILLDFLVALGLWHRYARILDRARDAVRVGEVSASQYAPGQILAPLGGLQGVWRAWWSNQAYVCLQVSVFRPAG